MERQIGEVFQCNGDWYQCVEAPIDKHSCNGCQGCKGVGGPRIFGGECNGNARKDGKFVIFKKLEKVGEPTMLDGKLAQKILTTDRYSCNGCCFLSPECDKADNDLCCEYEIYVEIKQTNEDMEDLDKIKVRDYTKVEELNVMEEKKLNLKPFDIQKAREGKPVCTRDGRRARIICFDAKFPKTGNIITLVEKENGEEIILYHYDDGYCSMGRSYDLMMLPDKKEGWINIYKGGLLDTKSYSSKEEAVSKASQADYIDTIKISWEE